MRSACTPIAYVAIPRHLRLHPLSFFCSLETNIGSLIVRCFEISFVLIRVSVLAMQRLSNMR